MTVNLHKERSPVQEASADWAVGSPSAQKSDRAYDAYLSFHRMKEAGLAPSLEEFCARYPSLKTDLFDLLKLDAKLENNPHLVDDRLDVAWPIAGDLFCCFRLLRELGRGGFARVFLAVDTSLGGRPVVLKISAAKSPEAQLLGPIDHANVVAVLSTHTEEATGLIGVCMPYEGTATLQTVLRALGAGKDRLPSAKHILDVIQASELPSDPDAPSRPIAKVLRNGSPAEGICHLFAQVADGLAHIHGRGICHRDLKPSNILLRRDGTPILLDFNLSTGIQAEAAQIAGTVPYMAPEILRELTASPTGASKPDTRADIYALGVILYQFATGKHPFGDVNSDLSITDQSRELLKRQAVPPIDPAKLNPAIDRSLAQLILRCLRPNPNDRPASAADIASALRRRFSWHRRAWHAIVSRPGLAAAAVVASLTVAIAAGGNLANQPDYKDRCYTEGISLGKKGEYPEAIKKFNEAIANGLQGARPFVARAAALQRLAEKEPAYFQNALADLREADARESSGEIKAGMAYCLLRMQQYQPSIALSEDALKLGFDSAEAHANYGFGLLRLGKMQQAKIELDLALQKKPNLRSALHARATVGYTLALMEIGKLKLGEKNSPEAGELRYSIECMTKAAQLGDRSATASLVLARLHGLATRIDLKERTPMLTHLRAAMEAGAGEDAPQDIIFAPFQGDTEFAEIAKIRPQRRASSPVCHADPLGTILAK